MNDIQQPASLALVRPRDEGRSQGGGAGRDPGAPPAKKVADAYKENAKAKPVDDRITILGIPAEQITPATQAALASLVAEVNFLRSAARRMESGMIISKRDTLPAEGEVVPADLLPIQLARFLALAPAPDTVRVLVLAYLGTFEDVRRSSGLLAANGLLADLAQRMSRAEFAPSTEEVFDVVQGKTHAPGLFKLRVMGYAGGSSLAGIAEVPAHGLDETHISRQIRDRCLETGFNVGGIDMSVALSVAAVVISANEGALTAMARADHLLRGSNV
ncbi:MAG: hypothetical protein JNK21_03365 [Rhodospirillaceae bacterium]|nr:hypothetical protein [Rhodospirillaceae bacterium]